MPEVFTVYNCGTGSDRDSSHETVARLAKATAGDEAGRRSDHQAWAAAADPTWMITDGVGKLRGSDSKAFTPGLRDPVTLEKTTRHGLRTMAKPFQFARGTATGWGWQHNVDYAMHQIKSLAVLPRKINMCGWSRGAITCHKLAHALMEDPDTSRIKVNIFAFDPVPGPGNFVAANITLPPNVSRYAVVQMEDERRKIMEPMRFDEMRAGDHGFKKFSYYAMPGQHNTGVVMNATPVGNICWSLAVHFLQRNDTVLPDLQPFTPVRYVEEYAFVRRDLKSLRNLHGGILGKMKEAARKRRIANIFRDHHFFINEHHEHVFRKVFPAVAALMNKEVASADELVRDLAAIQQTAPRTYAVMKEIGMI